MTNGGESQWRVDLKEFIEAVMQERDRRYEQRFQAQEQAIAEKSADTARRFENVNEFRGQLADQARTLMPRTEVEQRLRAMLEKVETLNALIGSSMPRNEVAERFKYIDAKIEGLVAADKVRVGRTSGFESTRVMVFAILAAFGTLGTIILAIYTLSR